MILSKQEPLFTKALIGTLIFIEIISYIHGKGKIFDTGGCPFEGYLWGSLETGSDWVCTKVCNRTLAAILKWPPGKRFMP